MQVLGIETSCDETACAIIQSKNGHNKILSNVIWSQIEEHSKFGGVMPEIAARAHCEKLDNIILQALDEAKIELQDIDAIAVTAGPGLIGGLMVGLITAKAMCLALDKKLIAVNHLEAHALTARLTHNIDYPYLLLLASGGHTQLLIIKNFQDYQRLGSTIDDALGEAFDKTAKLLQLGYPGGAKLEQKAQNGDKYRFNFPRPLKNSKNLDFSFSGLKTAVKNKIDKLSQAQNGKISEQDICDIAASFQFAVCDILKSKIAQALNEFKIKFPHKTHQLVLAGGVAANLAIQQEIKSLCQANDFQLIVADAKLCTDNAAMVAWAGIEHLNNGFYSKFDISARSRWPLDEKAAPLTGFGKKGVKV